MWSLIVIDCLAELVYRSFDFLDKFLVFLFGRIRRGPMQRFAGLFGLPRKRHHYGRIHAPVDEEFTAPIRLVQLLYQFDRTTEMLERLLPVARMAEHEGAQNKPGGGI